MKKEKKNQEQAWKLYLRRTGRAVLLVLFLTLFLPLGSLTAVSAAASAKTSTETDRDPGTADDAASQGKAEPSGANDNAESEDGALSGVTLDALEGKTAGVITGTPQDQFVKDRLTDPDLLYFNTFTDELLALQQGKIDYCLNSVVAYRISRESYLELSFIPDPIKTMGIGTIFPKTETGETLRDEMNSYIAQITADGTLEELKSYWLYPGDWEEVSIPAKGENGTLTMAGIATMTPFCFVINNGYGGLDTAIIAGFCEAYGYGLKIETVDFSGALSGVTAGKFDLAAGQIAYTDERAESVLYSDFYSTQDIVAFVRTADYADASGVNMSSAETNASSAGTDISSTETGVLSAKADTSSSTGLSAKGETSQESDDTTFWESLKRSFYRTLIKERRYITILSGLGVTLIITFFGFLLANLFGALFCAMSMSRSKVLRVLAEIYSRIMQGTPVVVILMILYYLIFRGKIQLPGMLVAIIGFGITSGAYLAQLFEGAIRSVDRGQTEAALAIGFTPFRAFNGIVLPQAIRNMLSGYFSQLISLMKGTAIVGYIAVNDLTKSGDIIRSSTFEPFFPLIVVAVLYFLTACILLSILKKVQKILAPKRVKAVNGGNAK